VGFKTPQFLYFDLGRVLLDFDVERMLRQIGAVAGLAPQRVREVIFDTGLLFQAESGALGTQEFYEAFCDRTGTQPERTALERAAGDIFELKTSVVPVVAQLRAAGHRMGVLSNTCACHWEHCVRRFRILTVLFDVTALSYQIGHVKPDRAIFLAAAELAGTPPASVFFVDDTPGHVEGARAAGFDAVSFTSTPQLVADLRARGVQFNY